MSKPYEMNVEFSVAHLTVDEILEITDLVEFMAQHWAGERVSAGTGFGKRDIQIQFKDHEQASLAHKEVLDELRGRGIECDIAVYPFLEEDVAKTNSKYYRKK